MLHGKNLDSFSPGEKVLSDAKLYSFLQFQPYNMVAVQNLYQTSTWAFAFVSVI